MPRSKPNFLWRSIPTPRTAVDTCELQTLAFDNNTKKPEWLSVASGDPRAIDIIAIFLSKQRFRMFPLYENEPGWPKDEGVIDDEEEADTPEADPPPSLGAESDAHTESGGALSGSTSTTRRPAIREPASRRALSGAAARAHAQRKEREGQEGRKQ